MVPNGKLLGQQFGDRYPSEEAWQKLKSGGGAGKVGVPTSGLKNVTTSGGKFRGVDDEEGPGHFFQ